MNELEVTKVDTKISSAVGYTEEQVAIIKSTVAKGTTNLQLAYFLSVCKSVGLNPFMKECWCYVDSKKNLLVFAGRDGFLAKAQSNPAFNGIRSCEVREKDEFSIDVANKDIKHKITGFGETDRGKIVGAYAIAFRKGGEPTIEFVEFARYNRNMGAWKTHPEDMIKKVAETHVLKKGFGISGLNSEYDFEVKSGIAKPLPQESDLELEVSTMREGMELTDKDFIAKVLKAEKIRELTSGAEKHLKKVLFEEKKYNWETGEKVA